MMLKLKFLKKLRMETLEAGNYKINIGQSVLADEKQQNANSRHSAVTATFRCNEYSDMFECCGLTVVTLIDNFKPESIDYVSPGTLKRDSKTDKWELSMQNQQSLNPPWIFTAPPAAAAKDTECVLIFDPETQSFTLEKLNASMSFQSERKPKGPSIQLIRRLKRSSTETNDPPISSSLAELRSKNGSPVQTDTPKDIDAMDVEANDESGDEVADSDFDGMIDNAFEEEDSNSTNSAFQKPKSMPTSLSNAFGGPDDESSSSSDSN